MNTNYGGKPEILRGGARVVTHTEMSDHKRTDVPDPKRSDSRDRGGNLRRKMYASKGGPNTSVLSDVLNTSTQGNSFHRDTSFLDNTELLEGEMNPEEVHYFFVQSIQKSRRLISQTEK